MSRLIFSGNPDPTLGVEIELALVDAETMALRSASGEILEQVPSRFEGSVKSELSQCSLEISTDVCPTVAAAERDLREKLQWTDTHAEQLGVRLHWSGTHPFSSWRDQQVTDEKHYRDMIDLLQDTARQLVTFSLHVHVGVDSGDKAIMICDRILPHLPTLLALSANSPMWEGRDTGICSWRSRLMDGLPTAGLPPLMRNWSEYVWVVNHLVHTGYVQSPHEIWWDTRPQHTFGTVEVRVCDVPGSLDDALALVALTQCLVKALSDEIDHGTYQDNCHPMVARQNKWEAARYGLNAHLVNSRTYEHQPARQVVAELVERLRLIADQLNCSLYLDRVLKMIEQPTWAQRQLDIFNETGDPAQVVRRMTDAARVAHAL